MLGNPQLGLIFMQHSAPIHEAKKAMKWFEDNRVALTDWHPDRPDLKPTEYL